MSEFIKVSFLIRYVSMETKQFNDIKFSSHVNYFEGNAARIIFYHAKSNLSLSLLVCLVTGVIRN